MHEATKLVNNSRLARAPSKVIIPSHRAEEYDPDPNEEHRRADLHLADEKREDAMIQSEN